jgi:hypothetical protein
MITAPNVTVTVPMIIGKIPYSPRLGAHDIPKIKFHTPVSAIMGTPLAIINIVIRARAEIDESANIIKTEADNFSLNSINFIRE